MERPGIPGGRREGNRGGPNERTDRVPPARFRGGARGAATGGSTAGRGEPPNSFHGRGPCDGWEQCDNRPTREGPGVPTVVGTLRYGRMCGRASVRPTCRTCLRGVSWAVVLLGRA